MLLEKRSSLMRTPDIVIRLMPSINAKIIFHRFMCSVDRTVVSSPGKTIMFFKKIIFTLAMNVKSFRNTFNNKRLTKMLRTYAMLKRKSNLNFCSFAVNEIGRMQNAMHFNSTPGVLVCECQMMKNGLKKKRKSQCMRQRND